PAWDAQRTVVDTVVVHHTKLRPGVTWQRLDAIQLARVYARYYRFPGPHEHHIHGTPIHSGHHRDGRQVFYAYHWLVRADGAGERLLADAETGWQAGDWNVNCRSVAIALDGNLETADPPAEMLEGAAAIVRTHYPAVAVERVLGHLQVNPRTGCPGGRFLDGWRHTLHGLVASPT
ncbi:MAG TPA: peptidoglycan recognition family protein, partial [Gaiellales bacterium]|nr:peptidoglycan recognition family protein [Gaiellales bacterium]